MTSFVKASLKVSLSSWRGNPSQVSSRVKANCYVSSLLGQIQVKSQVEAVEAVDSGSSHHRDKVLSVERPNNYILMVDDASPSCRFLVFAFKPQVKSNLK